MSRWRRRWPWWARRELILPYLATVAVLATLIMAGGYWLMGELVAWRMRGLHG